MSVLERVFQQKISRSQQDAHEFLQVVAETLAEEYHKQKKLESGTTIEAIYPGGVVQDVNGEEDDGGDDEARGVAIMNTENSDEIEHIKGRPCEEDEGMPLEGKLESEIECQKCHFKPKSTVSTFVVLTLPVPQKVCSPGIYQWDTWF